MKQLLAQIDNVWINASAGSGKTTRLINRILQLMLCHETVPKILCLTFTNAAATEMQQRILGKLKLWENCSSEDLLNDLSTVLGPGIQNFDINSYASITKKARDLYKNKACYSVKINTIHAFCTNILRTFAVELRISSVFRVIDEQEQLLLLEEVLRVWCQQRNLSIDITMPNKQVLLDCCSVIPALCDAGNSKNFFHNTIASLKILFHVEQYKIDKNDFITNTELLAIQNQIITSTYSSNRILALSQNNDFWQKHRAKLDMWLSGQQNAASFFDEYKIIFLTKNGEPRKRAAGLDKEVEDLWFDEQRAVMVLDGALRDVEGYAQNYNIIFICCELLQQLERNMRWKNMLSYRDIIFYTNCAISQASYRDAVKYHIARAVDHLLVDEAQDNSREQWLIIDAIAEDFLYGHTADNTPKTLFFVGDAKQSIYSFQGADPAFFTEMQSIFMAKARFAQRKISIIENHDCYRCSKKIVNSVNALLQQEDFQRAAMLARPLPIHIANSDLEGLVCHKSISSPSEKMQYVEYEDSGAVPYDAGAMTTQIAQDIKYWVENGKDIGTGRPTCFADIMVLVRKRDQFLAMLISAFNRHSIPYTLEGSVSRSNNILLQDFLSIARAAISTNDHMSLCIVLKSWMFNYNDNHLLRLRQRNFELSAINYNDRLVIKNLRYMAALSVTPHDFFCGVFWRLGYLDALFERLGDAAYELAESWLSALQELERKNNVRTLRDLLAFCEKHNIVLPQATVCKANKVSVGTIHAAKGKEAPVVIVAQPKQAKAKNDPLGVFNGLPFYAWCSSDQIMALKHKIRQKFYEEELRLLYVALTRAKNELHFYSLSNADDESGWGDILRATLG